MLLTLFVHIMKYNAELVKNKIRNTESFRRLKIKITTTTQFLTTDGKATIEYEVWHCLRNLFSIQTIAVNLLII